MRSAKSESEVAPTLFVRQTGKEIEDLKIAPYLILHKIEDRLRVILHRARSYHVRFRSGRRCASGRDSIGPARHYGEPQQQSTRARRLHDGSHVAQRERLGRPLLGAAGHLVTCQPPLPQPRRPGMPRCARPCCRSVRSVRLAPCSPNRKSRTFFDFAGSGVDTQWAVQFRAVPDPAGFCLIVCLTRALSAVPQEMTGKAANRHPAPPRAVRGWPKSGCRIAHHGTRHDHPCTPGDGAGVARTDADRAARGRRRHRSGRSPSGHGRGAGGTCRATRSGLSRGTGSPSCRRASTPPSTSCWVTCTSSISSTAGRASAPAPTGSTGAPASTSAPPVRSCASPPRWPSCPTSPRPWPAAGSPIRKSGPCRGWLPLPPRRGCSRWPAAPPPRRWSGWCVAGGRQTRPRRRMASRYAWRAAC